MRLARLALLMLVLAAVPAASVVAQTPGPESDEQAAQSDEPKRPRCFGAASRDPMKRCSNPALRRMVFPTPADAELEPNSECRLLGKEGELNPCEFGVDASVATENIALVGDSHAAHWRAAIDRLMAEKQWRGISMTKAGCPLSTAVSDIPEPKKTQCIKFKRQLFRWFENHPEVTTVITSNHTGGKVVGARGRDYAAHVEGYAEALAKLAPSVKRVISIRDVPRNSRATMKCVRKAIRKKLAAGSTCALRRGYALRKDPATAAAQRSDPRRVQLVDLTRFMCGRRTCLPVVGGALVHKDETHLTRVFAVTLGPYLLRHVDRAFSHMAAGTRP